MNFIREKIDLIELMIFPLIAGLIGYGLRVNFFWSILLFFGIPACYLSLRSPKFIKRAAVFSALVSIPCVIIVDYIGHLSRQWVVPDSILSFRFFGQVPIEDLVLAFFNFYIVIVYYEYFLDKHFSKILLPHRLIKLLVLILIAMAVFLLLYLFLPNKLYIPYFYFLVGFVVFLIPVCIQLARYPKFTAKFFYSASYFFYLTLIYEITAQKLNLWIFPSHQVIGWVSMFKISFPFEELFFWIAISSMTILTAFERFEEGEK